MLLLRQTWYLVDHDMNTAREIKNLFNKFWHLPSVKHWQDAVVVTLADQAHANRPGGDSTGGLLTLIGGPEHQSGAAGRLSIVGGRTWKLKRKAICTNDGEVQSMLEGEDNNFRTRFLWTQTQINGCACGGDMLNRATSMVKCVGGIVGTDSKGGFDAVTPYMVGRRLEPQRCTHRTKKAVIARQGLMQFLRNFIWRLHYDPQFITSKKKSKQLGQGALRQMKELSALQPYTLVAF